MKILAACYGNTCRSPMLEGLLKRDLAALGKEITVESAGLLRIDQGATPHSITCMRERGIDITGHRSRCAEDLDLASFDHIYVMGGNIKDALVKLGVPADHIEILRESEGGVPNPFNANLPADQQDMTKYIPCAAVLEEESKRIAASL